MQAASPNSQRKTRSSHRNDKWKALPTRPPANMVKSREERMEELDQVYRETEAPPPAPASQRFAPFICMIGFTMLIYAVYRNSVGSGYGNVSRTQDYSPPMTQHGAHPTSIPVRALNQSHLEAIATEIRATKSRIHRNWDVDEYPLFLTTMNIPKKSWDIQRNKFIKLLLDSDIENREFVVGFSGSSVTAGHDSYFKEAFPNIFYETMLPVMEAIGVKLVVRNHALGNNPCYPYDACMETHMGDDLDILTWEQSMNCGRDPKPVETFTRAAVRMSKQPTVIYIASGTPTWKPEECDNITAAVAKRGGPEMTSAAGTANASSVRLGRLHAKSEDEKEALTAPLKSTSDQAAAFMMSATAFLKVPGSHGLHEYYSGLAPMSQNVMALQAYKCQGPYTREFSVKTHGGGASWHPGKMGHQMRGENLAYFFLAILEEAVSYIRPSVSPSRSLANTNSQDYSHGQQVRQSSGSLQHTRQREEGDPHRMMSASASHASVGGIIYTAQDLGVVAANAVAFLDDSRIPLNDMPKPVACHADACGSSSYCHTNYEPRMQNSLIENILNGLGNYTLELSFFDVKGVEKALQRGYGYLDRKNIFVSHGQGDVLSFYVNTTHPRAMWLCECQKGFLKYPAVMGDLDAAAELFIETNVDPNRIADGTYEPVPDRVAGLSLTLNTDQCYRTPPVPAGLHVLSLVQKGSQLINLGYVVHW